MTDLVQIFEDAATDSGYRFAYGAKDILNYELGKNVTLTSGEYVIMVFPMVETANVVNSAMNGFRVSTQIWIGRKFDTSSSTGTKSNLDETERQKYDRRLKALRAVADAYIQAVFCSTDLELISVRVFRELNKFATNIDFMTADIVFKYDLEYEPAIVLPAPVSAEIGAEADNLLVITFNKSLNEVVVPDVSAFTTSGITGDVQPESIEISGNKVELTLDGDAVYGDTITVSYTAPEDDPIEDLFENLCLTFADFEVTNNAEDLTLRDYDNNIYTIITVNSQEWIVENLKVTHYADGTEIPNLTDDTDWGDDTIGAYRWYINSIANKTPYGALYNRYAVENASGLAYFKRNEVQESGWRVATDADWTALATFLGGLLVTGGKLKEAGLDHWDTPNTGATNEVGFTALPGGYCTTAGVFTFINTSGYYWGGEWFRLMISNSAAMTRTYGTQKLGFSVRCVRDV